MEDNIFYREFSKNAELKAILESGEEVRGSHRSLEQFNNNLYGTWSLRIGQNRIKFVFEYQDEKTLIVQIAGDVVGKTSTIDAVDYEKIQDELTDFAVSLFNEDVEGNESEEGSFDDSIVDKTVKDATQSLDNSRLIYKVYGKK